MPSSSPPSARLRLLTGPAGSGKTHRALSRIRAAATEPGPRGRGAAAPGEALLLLPTYAQVKHVKRLALSRWEARGILDEPFTTFTAAGERFLDDFRVRALPTREERDRLMEEALRQCDEPLFHEIADRAGFRSCLLRLVKELKQTGLEGQVARAELLTAHGDPTCALTVGARERLEAFLRVFEAYEALLTRAGLEDHEDTLRLLAARLAERLPDRLPRVLVVDGFDDFTRVEEEILFSLADAVVGAGGEVVVTLPWDEARPLLFANSAGTRERLLRRGFVEEALVGFERAHHAPGLGDPLSLIATTLFRAPPPSAPALDGAPVVQSLIAGDAEDEAETVARTLRGLLERERLPAVRGWRDIGIVVRRVENHAARFQSAFARLGVPLRIIGPGDSLASEAVVRALRGPLAVLAGETDTGVFAAGGLMEWLRWLALAGGAGISGEPPIVDLDAFDMQLRQHGIPPDFAAFCERVPEALAAPVSTLARTAVTLQGAQDPTAIYDGLAGAVIDLLPLGVPSGFDAQGRPCDPAHDARLARATAARARIGDILADLSGAVARTNLGGALRVGDAIQELNDALEQTTLRLADRRLDAVTLMDAEEARFWELPVIVVAGLEEGSFPLRPQEDILLRDADRAALRERDAALRLPLAREREVRERRLFYGAVTRARTRLYLSRRAYNDKGDPKERSSFLRELELLVAPSVAALARTPGRVVRAKEECFTAMDWRLFAAGRLSPWSLRREGVSAADRSLAVALQQVTGTQAPARMARGKRRESDPLWSDAQRCGEVLARFEDCTQEVSVSRLNHAVACSYRFFLAYAAKIPQDDFTLDGPVFDARQRGSALHHAFELALKRPADTSAALAAAGVAHVKAKGLDARLLGAELERAVALLRAREHDTAGPLQPWPDGLELDFSKGASVELGPEDCRFKLGGHIDRVDRCPGEAGQGDLASVIDYKRSQGSVDISFKKGRDGVDLQLPLYARALEAMLGVRVVGFEWMAGLTRSRRIIHDADAVSLFAGRREANAPLVDEDGAFRARLEAAEATATAAVRRARAGDHARRPHDVSQCAACPWKGVCRPDTIWMEQQAAQMTDGATDGAPEAATDGGAQ